jgi:UDP-3-O-[3-hydroxymyristoyl] glucosamine N-acyltransferase
LLEKVNAPGVVVGRAVEVGAAVVVARGVVVGAAVVVARNVDVGAAVVVARGVVVTAVQERSVSPLRLVPRKKNVNE